MLKYSDESSTFTGLFYQDQHMREVNAAFPEVLLCDATYKLNDLRMPLYLLIGIDGNGHSQVFALYLTTTETAAALSRMQEVHVLLVTFHSLHFSNSSRAHSLSSGSCGFVQ